jgi:hypothetical protein
LGLEYEFVVSRFEFGESRKNKKIFWPSSIAVLDQQLLKKMLWNLDGGMKPAKDGERYYHNIFGVDVKASVIRVYSAGHRLLVVELQIMRWIFFTKHFPKNIRMFFVIRN